MPGKIGLNDHFCSFYGFLSQKIVYSHFILIYFCVVFIRLFVWNLYVFMLIKTLEFAVQNFKLTRQYIGKTSREKFRFLSGIARIRLGGLTTPEVVGPFQEVHFWSIK